jgi:UDP-N-acetylmuramoyl-L-alanine---L-glutamate ligase
VRFSELDGARVGVWGAGREIRSFARQLARRLPSAEILAVAFDATPQEDPREALAAPHARLLDAAESVEGLSQCEVLVRSPGVSIYRPELQALQRAGVKVTSATSLWLGEHGAKGVLGVTGTKGKSTTAALAAHLASAAGRSVRLAGNIGVPALELLDEEPSEIVVLELSSYQIADLDSGPEVALVTNLFKEHSDWHGSEAAYRKDKLRLLGLPGVRMAVLNGREDSLAGLCPPPEITRYGVAEGWDASGEGVFLRRRLVLSAHELPLPGEHNALNLCAALAGLEALGVSPPPQAALAGFKPLAHRLQSVLERDGTLWVDDSISTTPESTLAALASFPGRSIILIAGGQDRGQDYASLAGALRELQATVIGVPSTGERLLAQALAAGVEPERAIGAPDLREAVLRARAHARPGSVVLLSPAAPSFDHYRDFEQRGDRFSELARAPQDA